MFDRVILLTGPGEQALLSARLAECRPGLVILPAASKADLLALDRPTLARSRLIAFTASTIVPPSVLAGLGYGAYNFHPGPPEYPGLSPAQFALYHGAQTFGGTVHRMVQSVDAGPIVAIARFGVPAGATLYSLEIATFQHLARLFWALTPALVDDAPLYESDIGWGADKSTRRSTEAMCDIPLDIDARELQRRVAAFEQSPFGLTPTVTLHGYRFRLVPEPAEPAFRTENTAVPSAA
jgi:methionyl-tRNA formyltransferase